MFEAGLKRFQRVSAGGGLGGGKSHLCNTTPLEARVTFAYVSFTLIFYGLETVVSVLFSNARTRLLYSERDIFNTARSEAECSIENFELIEQ